MKTWSIYVRDSGLFTGRRYQGPEEQLRHNVPDECAAIEGVFDHLAQRVVDGEVQDWIPPAPADTVMVAHVWQPDVRRWLPVPTPAAIERERQHAIQAEIEALEARQARPMREFAIATDSAAMAAAVAKLADLDAQIAMRRVQLEPPSSPAPPQRPPPAPPVPLPPPTPASPKGQP